MADLPRILFDIWNATDPETTTDRLCDALGRHTEHRRFETDRGAYWMCRETGQMQRDFFPSSVDSTDRYDRWWRQHELDDSAVQQRVGKITPAVAKLAESMGKGRWYEVGAGLGYRMLAAQKLGIDIRGNELSGYAVQRGIKRFGLQMDHGLIESVDLEESAYDVVLLDNVFEHLEKPREVLCKVARSLQPGGAVYIHTINAQSLCLKHKLASWLYFSEAHLFVPSLISLEAYCQSSGLEISRCTTHGYRSLREDHRSGGNKLRRLKDKILSTYAARRGIGHRMDVVLRKPR